MSVCVMCGKEMDETEHGTLCCYDCTHEERGWKGYSSVLTLEQLSYNIYYHLTGALVANEKSEVYETIRKTLQMSQKENR